VLATSVTPGASAAAAWTAQLLGAAWLGLGTLNWLSRRVMLGGIYGRPIVAANQVMYFVGSMTLVREVVRGGSPPALVLLAVPVWLLAAAYTWLLFRGPTAGDLAEARAAGGPG
jgi:hypothetical protein